MNIGIAEAKGHLPKLIRAAEDGETIVITRHGKPVAQLTCVQDSRGEVVFDTMKDRIRLLPGWDDPITMDELLSGDA